MTEIKEVKETPPVYGILAEFETPEEILAAARQVYRMGYTKTDALTPYPIHGLDEALGMKRSILGYIVFGMGAFGVLAAILLQWYSNEIAYPLVVGGKPFFAIQPFIPVTFEVMVLFAAFAAVLGMLGLNGLPRFYHSSFNYSRILTASHDRYLLVVEKTDPKFHEEETANLLRALGGKHVEVVPE
jgi:hypothetical protein